MSKKRSLMKLSPTRAKQDQPKNILKNAKKFLTFKNIKNFFVYSISGLFALSLLLFAWFAKDLPSPNKINSRLLVESTQIFDRAGNLIYEIHGDKNRILLDYADMPQYCKDATVAIEDKEFWQHGGFSVRGIGRAFSGILSRQSRGGGSTITQQFVKNALLTSERTLTRKAKELILSMEIELVYSKEEILKMYLNEIPYGSTAYGLEAASKTYFAKSAKDLKLEECAILAALPQAPTYFSPYGSQVDKLMDRKNIVLTKMAEQGYITEAESQEAKKKEIAFSQKRETITYPHFVMYVKEKLVEKYGEKLVEEGGLRVTTTIDPEKQAIAKQVVEDDGPKKLRSAGASNASLVSIDPKTGQILAMIGSVDYWSQEVDGNVNVAIRERQPGSSFKPFAYAASWKKEGYGPGTPMFDLVTDFGGNPPYKPKNFNGREHGIQSMRQSLAQSLNIPAVKALYIAGIKNTIDTAHDMGITTLNAGEDHYGLSLVLGSGEVKLLDMTSAYGVFANKGLKQEVTPILKVEDSSGKVLEEYKDSKGKQVIDPQIAYLMSDVLSDDSARAPIFGRGGSLTLGSRPVAAKTGTTQEYRDAWTLGYTPSLVTGVWAGNNDNTPMKSGASGSMAAAPLWNNYMRKALAGTPIENFEQPRGIKTITLDKVTGKRPIEGSETITDKFPSWYKAQNTTAKNYKINKIDGKLATEDCAAQVVETVYGASVTAEIPPNDPAYSRWIRPISAWANARGYSVRVAPEEYTDLCDPGKRPSVSIELNKTNIEYGEGVIVTANVNAPLDVLKVEFFVDDRLQASDTTEPYIKTLVPNDSGSRKITVKVTDKGYNTASDSGSVFVSGDSYDFGMNLSVQGNTFTATYNGVADSIRLWLIREDSTKTMQTMTKTSIGWTWVGNKNPYVSAYAEASTSSGPKLSKIITW